MLSNNSLANLLTEQFNAQGTAKNFKFAIFPDAKAFLIEPLIQGILVASNSEGMPLSADNSFISRKYSYYITFAIVDADTGTRTKAFNTVVVATINAMQGKTFDLDEGKALITFDTPVSNGTAFIDGAGEGVLASLSLSVLFTQNAITTGSKVWLLNGVNMRYLEESIDLDIQGATNNIYGLNATQSLPIKQTKYYRFELPYDNSSPVSAALQRDMLEGDMTKTYKLSYYDGVAYTQENPYITTVSLFRTGNSGAVTPDTSNFKVVFTDADDGTSGSVLYEMALMDNPFDDNSVNVRYFEDRASQQAWHTEKIATGAPYSPIKAPNLNNLTITQQVYIKPLSTNLDLNSLLTKNYAVIRATDKATGNVLYYYYYYIQTSNVGANNMILVDLKMDTIQTYYFDPQMQIPDCVIERAHLNRWIENGDGTVRFDNFPNSAMLNNEGANLPKRQISRAPLKFCIDKSNASNTFNNMIKDAYWVLIYVNNFGTNRTDFSPYVQNLKINDLDTNYKVFALPFSNNYKYSIKLRVRDEIYEFGSIFTLTTKILDLLAEKVPANIINMKITPICPFNVANYVEGIDYTISNNRVTLIFEGDDEIATNYKADATLYSPNGKNTWGAVFIREQSINSAFAEIDLPFETIFNNSSLKSKSDIKYNPKFLSSTINELHLVDYAGNRFQYDIQKINNKKLVVYCNESLSVDLTKGYVRLKDNIESCYNNGCQTNYTGLVYSNDTSIPFSVSQLADFLANNKNYALMQQANRDYRTEMMGVDFYYNDQKMMLNLGKSALSAFTSFAQGDFGSAFTNGASGIFSLASYSVDKASMKEKTQAANNLNEKMQNFTLDNMKAAPPNLKNAQGNILFSSIIDTDSFLTFYVEYYCALDADLLKMHNYFNMFGFGYEIIDSIKKYNNIRNYYNYVQARIENIQGITISNDARNDIRRRFASGIRFWNSDIIQYDLENYEKWLTN